MNNKCLYVLRTRYYKSVNYNPVKKGVKVKKISCDIYTSYIIHTNGNGFKIIIF